MLPIAIIAGGLGTRMRPITEKIPKALVPINGRPFISYQLELLCRHGFTDFVICVGYLGEMVEDFVGDGSRFNCRVSYSYDGPKRIGTAGAIANALQLLGQHFFITYGDAYLDCDYQAIQEAFERSGLPALMAVYKNEGRFAPSNVEYESARIKAYDKVTPTPEMSYIDYGVSILSKTLFTEIPNDRPTDLAVIFQNCVNARALAGFVVPTRFYEIGTPESVAEVELYLTEQK